ncbi:Pca regulon regulatory protein PcaR [Klebsiella aerogenes]|nr:Pca regulon regulatory protein PcaR [Klebsiella aerogenes]
MDKHPDDLLTGDGDPFKGDPNFMASLARGLEVIQAFTPQRPLLSISQISQKTGIPRAGGAPLPVYPEQAGVRVCRRR